MIRVEREALYDRKDLAELFQVSTRSVDRYYSDGLPRRHVRGKNYTYGYEVDEWMRSGGGQQTEEQNPKLVQFRKKNAL